MRSISQRLILEELRAGGFSDAEGHAAFRVCEKLRRPLSTLAGIAGFRSLLSRALMLAKADAPWLGGLQIKPDGTFAFPAEMEAQLDGAEAAKSGRILVNQLLGLLVTFIGEALTLRLIREVWPKATIRELKSGKKQP